MYQKLLFLTIMTGSLFGADIATFTKPSNSGDAVYLTLKFESTDSLLESVVINGWCDDDGTCGVDQIDVKPRRSNKTQIFLTSDRFNEDQIPNLPPPTAGAPKNDRCRAKVKPGQIGVLEIDSHGCNIHFAPLDEKGWAGTFFQAAAQLLLEASELHPFEKPADGLTKWQDFTATFSFFAKQNARLFSLPKDQASGPAFREFLLVDKSRSRYWE